MFVKGEVFKIFEGDQEMSFDELHAAVKQTYGYDLLFYQYATLVGMKLIAENKNVTLEYVYNNAYVNNPSRLLNIPKVNQYINERPIATSTCGGCGGGAVL